MSEIVALPQPEEVKGTREKQQQREQESLRYLESPAENLGCSGASHSGVLMFF